MTNAEKYLKEGVDLEELCTAILNSNANLYKDDVIEIKCFFEEEPKPTLTADERVILRNIPEEYPTIARNLVGELSVRNPNDWKYADALNHLFQFIKNGEEYSIEELLK